MNLTIPRTINQARDWLEGPCLGWRQGWKYGKELPALDNSPGHNHGDGSGVPPTRRHCERCFLLLIQAVQRAGYEDSRDLVR